VAEILRIAALPELAEEAHRVLPDRSSKTAFSPGSASPKTS
jgi:hypothetical protein